MFEDYERRHVSAFLPGDTHRGLNVSSSFSHINTDLCLLPIYLWSYRYRDKLYRFMVNGQTGRVQGEAPISWWKVALAVLIVLILLGCIFAAMMLFEQVGGDDLSMLHPMQKWVSTALNTPDCTVLTQGI